MSNDSSGSSIVASKRNLIFDEVGPIDLAAAQARPVYTFILAANDSTVLGEASPNHVPGSARWQSC